MPVRVKPPPINKGQQILLDNIDFLAKRCGIARVELQIIFGFGQNTYYERRANPGTFKFEELQRFAKRVNVPVEKLLMERKWSA